MSIYLGNEILPGNIYLGSQQLGKMYDGTTLVFTSTETAIPIIPNVPTNLYSSSYVDMMFAPYVTSSINDIEIFDLVSKTGSLLNNLSLGGINNNAIINFDYTLDYTGSFSNTSMNQPNTGNASQNVIDMWIYVNEFTTYPDLYIWSFTNNIFVNIGGLRTRQTDGGGSAYMNQWNNSPAAFDNSGIAGYWTYFVFQYERSGAPISDYRYKAWYKRIGDANFTSFQNQIGGGPFTSLVPHPNNRMIVSGYPTTQIGVIRHYNFGATVFNIDDLKDDNFNAEASYFF
jgi:hypothetical protein